MYNQLMNKICNWCIKFLYIVSDTTDLSYEEINVWLLIIIQPGLIIFFFVNSIKWKKKYFIILRNRENLQI